MAPRHNGQYTKCSKCSFGWNFRWRHKCYSCNHVLLPAHAQSSQSQQQNGKWSLGPPKQTAAAAGKHGGDNHNNNSNGSCGPTKVEAMSQSSEMLRAAGVDEDLLQLLDQKLVATKQENVSARPAWIQLQRKEKDHTKLKKQIESKKDSIAKAHEQLAQLQERIKEESSELAAMETKEAEMAATVDGLRDSLQDDGDAEFDSAKVVSGLAKTIGLPESVSKSEHGEKLLATIARLCCTLTELKKEHAKDSEQPADGGATPTGSQATNTTDIPQAEAVPGEGGVVDMDADDDEFDNDSQEFLASLNESQKKFGARLLAAATDKSKRPRVAKAEPTATQVPESQPQG